MRKQVPDSQTTRPSVFLQPNMLAAINRAAKSDPETLFGLGDGTPTVPKSVVQTVLERLDIPRKEEFAKLLSTMTYAPVTKEGVYACKNRLALEFPEFMEKDKEKAIISGGDERVRLIQSTSSQDVTGQPFVDILLDQYLSASIDSKGPLRLTVTPEEYAKHTDRLQAFVTETNNLLCIRLDHLLPQPKEASLEEEAWLHLSLDVYGNKNVQKKAEMISAYVGPVFAPLAQALYGHLKPTDNVLPLKVR